MGRPASTVELIERALHLWADLRICQTAPVSLKEGLDAPVRRWTWDVNTMDYRPKGGKNYYFRGWTLEAALRKAIREGRRIDRLRHPRRRKS
jgi:hypothetical protein